MVVMMVHIEGKWRREQEKEEWEKMKLKSRSQFRHNLHGISKMQLA